MCSLRLLPSGVQQASGAVINQGVAILSVCAAGVVALVPLIALRGAGDRARPFRFLPQSLFHFASAKPGFFPGTLSTMFAGQFDRRKGCRIGEAQNPGPARQTDIRDFCFRPAYDGSPHRSAGASQEQRSPPVASPSQSFAASAVTASPEAASLTVRIAVINPTSLLHKDREILDLGQDIILASETSAVEAAQRLVSSKLRPAGLNTVWSAPVAPHQAQREHQTTLRGHAAGVALISRFPARKSFVPLDSQIEQAARLIETHVRIGQCELRVFVLYGFPANYQDAGSRNAALLQEVLHRLLACPVPAIVGGDFNTDVTTLPEFDFFQQLGFVEAFQYWRQRTGQELPPTCKHATRHDTLLLPGLLLPYVQAMSVGTDLHLFDSHAPFLAELSMPLAPPCQHGWRKPATWMTVLPPGVDLSSYYSQYQGQVQAAISSCRDADDLSTAFHVWASANEAAVDAAIRATHLTAPALSQATSLPRSAKGRCSYRPLCKRPYPRSAPQGRSGDYTPSCEAVSIVARAKVKQVRRMSTFVQGLAKVAAVPVLQPVVPRMGSRHTGAGLFAQFSHLAAAVFTLRGVLVLPSIT